jgi:ankyrin repeat protein
VDLWQAIASRDFRSVHRLIAGGADVGARAGDGTTPLMAAADIGHAPIVRLLLAAGARADDTDGDGASALLRAARNGHRCVFEILEPHTHHGRHRAATRAIDAAAPRPARADPRARKLVATAAEGRIDDLRRLIAAGVDLQATGREKVPAIYAAAEAGRVEAVEALLAAGADPDSLSSQRTPLWIAADRGHLDVVRLLLDAGASRDAADRRGEWPLFRAVAGGHRAVARALLEAGTVLGTHPNDRRLLEMVIAAGDDDLARELEAHGVDPVERTFLTLHHAARSGDLGRARAALAEGAPLRSPRNPSIDAMHPAAYGGHAAIARLLVGLDRPADERARLATRGLVVAGLAGHLDIVRALVEAGADVNAVDAGLLRTPLVAAVEGGNAEVVRFLLVAGADVDREAMGTTPLAAAANQPEILALLASRGGTKRIDGVPLADLRGVASFDVDESWLAVRSDVEQASRAFAELRGARDRRRDVAGRPVAIARTGFIAFRIRGHDWTLITDWGRGDEKSWPRPEDVKDWLRPGDAEALSARLGTRAVYFSVSDTAGAVSYALYEAGHRLEVLEDRGETRPPVGDRRQRPGLAFESGLRTLTSRQLRRPEVAIDAIFRDLGIWIPSMGAARHVDRSGQTVSLTLPGLDPSDLERLDYVALR